MLTFSRFNARNDICNVIILNLHFCTPKKQSIKIKLKYSRYFYLFYQVSYEHTRIYDKNDICNVILLNLHFHTRFSFLTEKRVKI